MFKFVLTFLLLLSISTNLHAENKIKRTISKKEIILPPKSAKIIVCKEKTEKYSIITSDYCTVIENYFNSTKQ